MKKRLIVGAIAAVGMAASANAGYFAIAGASYNPGAINLTPNSFNMQTNEVTDFTANTAGSGPGTISAITNGTDLVALAGITAAADTVTYFSYQVGTLGYFGIIINSTVNRSMNISMLKNGGDGASGGTKGVMTNASISGETLSGGNFIDTNQAIGIGKTFYVFGGLKGGSGFNGSVGNGTGESGNFGINYLSWESGSWVSKASLASGATASSISVAAYVVPVPAPALLAGAGLIGAVALRRRMK
jgi:hypothetical protein